MNASARSTSTRSSFGGNFLFLMMVTSHLALFHLLFTGTLLQLAICCGVYFLTGCLGISMTFHRLLSHGAWSPPRWMEAVGTFLGTIGLTGSSIGWSAIHTAHHKHVDTSEDPHSPIFKGFGGSHFLSMYETPNLLYVKNLVKDPLHQFFHKYYLHINFAWAGCLFLIDPYAVVYAYLAPAAILWNGVSSINSFCHKFGYKNFNTKDSAKNNLVFGVLTFGEGWHNNHHQYPMRSSFKVRAWELDIGGGLISLLTKINPAIAKRKKRL